MPNMPHIADSRDSPLCLSRRRHIRSRVDSEASCLTLPACATCCVRNAHCFFALLYCNQTVVLRESRQHEALEVYFLWDVVGVKLQADGPYFDAFGFRVAPVHHGVAIDRDSNPVALGQDLDVVPVMLLADLLGRSPVHFEAVASE